MSDHELDCAIVLERSRLEQRARVVKALRGNGNRTPESALRAADWALQAADDAVKVAGREVERDRAYRATIIQTMFGPRTRAQNDDGLRTWAEGLLADRLALLSGGSPGDGVEARLRSLAVDALNAKIKNKRVEIILADVLGRMERTAAREAALREAFVRRGAAEEHRAKLASAGVGCLDTAMAIRLVEESREKLAALEREGSARGPRPDGSLGDGLRERIERNRARAMQLRAAKRARSGEPPVA